MKPQCTVIVCQDDESGRRWFYNRASLARVFILLGSKYERSFTAADAVLESSMEEADCEYTNHVLQSAQRRPDGSFRVQITRSALMRKLAISMREAHLDVQISMFDMATAVVEQRKSVIVLLCGTAGTGKSTLASLLGQRLGISTVVSTDSIRNMMRGFVSKTEDPVLHASTYEAGSIVQAQQPELAHLTARKLVKLAYKAQCQPIMQQVQHFVRAWHGAGHSAIVEGVHLHLKLVAGLMQRFSGILPFLVYIKKEQKHAQRMSVRAKYMTTDPAHNKYIRNISSIRCIQDFLLTDAEKRSVPRIANSNVDVSVGIIHATVLAALQRQHEGRQLFDAASGRALGLAEEFESVQQWQSESRSQLHTLRAGLRSLVSVSSSLSHLPDHSQPSPVPPLHPSPTRGPSPAASAAMAKDPMLCIQRKHSMSTSRLEVGEDGLKGVVYRDSASTKVTTVDNGAAPNKAHLRASPKASANDSHDTGSALQQQMSEDLADSSDESESQRTGGGTKDDESDDQPHCYGSCFSTTDMGSLESADPDDNELLGSLWAALFPKAPAWEVCQEPKRTAQLCGALVQRLQRVKGSSILGSLTKRHLHSQSWQLVSAMCGDSAGYLQSTPRPLSPGTPRRLLGRRQQRGHSHIMWRAAQPQGVEPFAQLKDALEAYSAQLRGDDQGVLAELGFQLGQALAAGDLPYAAAVDQYTARERRGWLSPLRLVAVREDQPLSGILGPNEETSAPQRWTRRRAKSVPGEDLQLTPHAGKLSLHGLPVSTPTPSLESVFGDDTMEATLSRPASMSVHPIARSSADPWTAGSIDDADVGRRPWLLSASGPFSTSSRNVLRSISSTGHHMRCSQQHADIVVTLYCLLQRLVGSTYWQ